MKPEVIDQLVELNQRFYQSFAIPFSETRQRLQPGVTRLMDQIPNDASILDLGCGGGTLAVALAQRGQRGPYLGLDFSAELLEKAQGAVATATGDLQMAESSDTGFDFRQADLADPAWPQGLPTEPWDFILAFAVLHHLPGHDLRRGLVAQIRDQLAGGGKFMLSNWQFLNSERLIQRVQPWERAGINPDEVESGDALLDWRRGGSGLRYVHHFSPDELRPLAEEAGFVVEESFLSDGEGGKLGLYQVWVPK